MSVPPLIRGGERLQHRLGCAELLAERARHLRVVLAHPVEVAAPRDRELEPDPEAMQGRIAGADELHRRRRSAYARHLVLVLDRLQRDVVAEPLRLLVRVGVAADAEEQGRVVDDRSFIVIEPHPLRQAQRDEALAQNVLHRLPEAEVDAERERGDELRQPNVRPVDLAGHAPNVPFGVRARKGSDRGGPARATAGGAATRQGSSIRPFAALSLC
jgi:hypothetical protein